MCAAQLNHFRFNLKASAICIVDAMYYGSPAAAEVVPARPKQSPPPSESSRSHMKSASTSLLPITTTSCRSWHGATSLGPTARLEQSSSGRAGATNQAAQPANEWSGAALFRRVSLLGKSVTRDPCRATRRLQGHSHRPCLHASCIGERRSGNWLLAELGDGEGARADPATLGSESEPISLSIKQSVLSNRSRRAADRKTRGRKEAPHPPLLSQSQHCIAQHHVGRR